GREDPARVPTGGNGGRTRHVADCNRSLHRSTDSMRILIADDNVLSRTILADELMRWGYETLLAVDGNEALALLEADGGPRLAILDWVMPGLDGVEVCRRVRQRGGAYRYLLLLTGK